MAKGNGTKRVAMLMGGGSAEREVSLVSGKECADALEQAGGRPLWGGVRAGMGDIWRKAGLKLGECFLLTAEKGVGGGFIMLGEVALIKTLILIAGPIEHLKISAACQRARGKAGCCGR